MQGAPNNRSQGFPRVMIRHPAGRIRVSTKAGEEGRVWSGGVRNLRGRVRSSQESFRYHGLRRVGLGRLTLGACYDRRYTFFFLRKRFLNDARLLNLLLLLIKSSEFCSLLFATYFSRTLVCQKAIWHCPSGRTSSVLQISA